MTHLTYLQAAVVGLVQGVSELFPISSLGHAVLIPAVIGGQWAQNLNVAADSSPYLAFIVGLHVATSTPSASISSWAASSPRSATTRCTPPTSGSPG